ncbi:MAG: PH domain-containing protein [Candidatus Micrarchaeota archaeon]|nr:PH domain-containing protein [Candidatus Micrarchaeota archaeon]
MNNDDQKCEKITTHPGVEKYQIKIAAIALVISVISLLLIQFISANIETYLLAIIWGIAILLMIIAEINKRFVTVDICTEDLTFTKGILKTKATVIKYPSITNLHVNRDILDRILGLGQIQVDTAGSTGIELEVDGLKMEHIKEIIKRAQKTPLQVE